MKRAGKLVAITVFLSRDFRLKCNFRQSVEHGQKVFLISEFVLNGIELLLRTPLDLCTNEAALVAELWSAVYCYIIWNAGLSHFIVVLFFVLFLTSIKSINEHWTALDNNDNL